MVVLAESPSPTPPRRLRSERTGAYGAHRDEAALRDALGRGNVTAAAEVFRRHGDVAYAIALTITGEPERAEQAVVAAFVQLTTGAAEPRAQRALRVEVLDAARRCAGALAPDRSPPRRGEVQPRDVYRSLPPRVRDVLALAIVGDCGCIEIAAITSANSASVRRELIAGVRHALAVLAPPPPPARRMPWL